MKKQLSVALVAGIFAMGVGVGMAAQKLSPSLYHGKSKADAAKALLDAARQEAGDGSWERIAIGRIYYLGGHKAEGQAMFDSILSGKHEPSDEFRIARVYREAGEWNRAKPMFDSYVARNPKDEKEIAEVGAYYLLAGDRDTAESLFDKSFAITSELWATIPAAGAYLGVVPQP